MDKLFVFGGYDDYGEDYPDGSVDRDLFGILNLLKRFSTFKRCFSLFEPESSLSQGDN